MIPMGLFAEVEIAFRRRGIPDPNVRALRALPAERSGRGRRRAGSAAPRWRRQRRVAAAA